MNKLEKAIIKFNSGRLALLCSGCRKIVKEGKEFNEEESMYARGEIEHLPPIHCEECITGLKKEQNG